MREILLVFHKSHEYSGAIEEDLRHALKERGEDINVTTSENTENAKSRLPGEALVVVTALDIKETGKATEAKKEEGARLIAWMNREQMAIPAILVMPDGVERLSSGLPLLQNYCAVREGAGVVADTVAQALVSLSHAPQRCLDVEIRLLSRTQWMCEMNGRGFIYKPKSRVVTVPEMDVRRLETMSNNLAEVKEFWQDTLEVIGHDILEVLRKDPNWGSDLTKGIKDAGGEANTRVKFVVQPDLYRVAFEAVWCPQAPEHYWMLNAPVYRHLETEPPVTRPGVFSGHEIDCLIIDATTSGNVTVDEERGIKVNLVKIPSVRAECDWLIRWLEKAKGQYRIGKVELLRADANKAPLKDQVKTALENRDWTLVHYAGHAWYGPKYEPGWGFFPGANPGEVDKIELPRFGGWLERATFVYMSSCDAAAGPFVFKLAERRVPIILGFRWEIDDALAAEFSKTFYPALFESRSPEQAFLKARKAMHDSHCDDRIWAAPILIDQLGES